MNIKGEKEKSQKNKRNWVTLGSVCTHVIGWQFFCVCSCTIKALLTVFSCSISLEYYAPRIYNSSWFLRNGLTYLDITTYKFSQVHTLVLDFLIINYFKEYFSPQLFDTFLRTLYTMANTCLQFTGFVMSFLGWIGLIIATATNEWVVTCKYSMNTCKKMDELEAKGLWADCVISTALYHCITLTQILELPGTCEIKH